MFNRRQFLATGVAFAFQGGFPAAAGPTSYFSSNEHQALIADASYIHELYLNNRSRYLRDLGPGFALEIEEHLKFGFCGLVAFDLKPYGPSIDASLDDLLAADVLDCDNYSILTWRLFNKLVPQPTTQVAAVGWNGGAVGNHAQMFCNKAAGSNGNGGGKWVVDATVGVLVCGFGFDEVASGVPVTDPYFASFHSLCGRSGGVTEDYHSMVVKALRNGAYRPSDLLYYYVDLERYIAPVPDFRDWMTPQGPNLH